MKLQNSSGRWLRFLLILLLLAYNISYGPVKINVSPIRFTDAGQTFCAPAVTKDNEQILCSRINRTGPDFVRTRLFRYGALTYFTGIFTAFTSLALIFRLLLRLYSLHIRNILPRALLLVRFLHKSDGKASIRRCSYRIA